MEAKQTYMDTIKVIYKGLNSGFIFKPIDIEISGLFIIYHVDFAFVFIMDNIYENTIDKTLTFVKSAINVEIVPDKIMQQLKLELL